MPALLRPSLVLTLALAAPRAQCNAFGLPCGGGGSISCDPNAPPRIGTVFQACNRRDCALGFALLGGCRNPGIPIAPPLACPECPGCEWLTHPFVIGLPHQGCLVLPIPNDPMLIGRSFCVQSTCTDVLRACLCLSNVIQVTVQA
jgi:hypothetical protein